MRNLISIKLFFVTLVCLFMFNYGHKQAKINTNTMSDIQFDTVTPHFDSFINYFDLYTLSISSNVMNITKIIYHNEYKNEIILNIVSTGEVSYDNFNLDTG